MTEVSGPLNLLNYAGDQSPWWMRLVAWTETITAGYLMAHFVYSIFTVPETELEIFLWKICCGGLAALTGLVQSFKLWDALRVDNKLKKIFLCEVWFLCHGAFILELVLVAILYAAGGIPPRLVFGLVFEVASRFTYQIVSSLVVGVYYHQLKQSI